MKSRRRNNSSPILDDNNSDEWTGMEGRTSQKLNQMSRSKLKRRSAHPLQSGSEDEGQKLMKVNRGKNQPSKKVPLVRNSSRIKASQEKKRKSTDDEALIIDDEDEEIDNEEMEDEDELDELDEDEELNEITDYEVDLDEDSIT